LKKHVGSILHVCERLNQPKIEAQIPRHDVCERLDEPKIEAQTQETDACVRTQIELLVDKPIWSIIVINLQDHQTTEIIEESVLL
jgi:hypothetical protein